MSAAFERLIRVRSRQREIDALGCVVWPGGHSGLAGAGLVVVQGHTGGERSDSSWSCALIFMPTDALMYYANRMCT